LDVHLKFDNLGLLSSSHHQGFVEIIFLLVVKGVLFLLMKNHDIILIYVNFLKSFHKNKMIENEKGSDL